MKCFATQFTVAAIALVFTGTANAAFVADTAGLEAAAAFRVTDGELSNPLFHDHSQIGFSTRLELNLVETERALVLKTEPSLRASPFGPAGPSPLPEFPTILAGLLLLVPLGASTLRILMKRSAA